MKALQTLFCLIFLLEMYYCSAKQSKESKKEVRLAYSCLRIRGDESKNEEKNPIILIHGLGTFKEIWMGLYEMLALKTGRRVCIADLRNHGDSPWSNDYDVAAMASNFNSLLKTLKSEKAIILGHSLGGKVAIHFALTNPNKVEKLIVEDMRPNGITDGANQYVTIGIKLFRGAINAVPKGATETVAKKIVYQYLKKALGENFELTERVKEYLPIKCKHGNCEWKMNLKLFEKIISKDSSKVLTRSTGLFNKPALFIYGNISPFKIFDAKNEIEKLFPKVKFVGVEGAGHTVNKFPEYRDQVIKFINEDN